MVQLERCVVLRGNKASAFALANSISPSDGGCLDLKVNACQKMPCAEIIIKMLNSHNT